MSMVMTRPFMMFPDDPHIEMPDGRKMFGGSFFHAPTSSDILTINLMKEYPLECDIYIPIQDYACPDSPQEMIEAFNTILSMNKDVYVGCFGGVGRTGLFMSSFLKYLGHDDPIRQVRNEYHPHAVETQIQVDFLNNFPVAPSPRTLRPR